MTIGERIKLKRQELEFTQEELGRSCGASKQTIFKYETGIITNIPLDKIHAIALCLGVTPGYLMGWETEAQMVDGTLAAMVGERIKEQREANDLTLEQLSEKVFISPDRLARFEDASQMPTLSEFCRLDDCFNCGLDYLAGRIWAFYGKSVDPELSDRRQSLIQFIRTTDDKMIDLLWDLAERVKANENK